jgi:zinc D-Ala-D-Ala carboxypeptidase
MSTVTWSILPNFKRSEFTCKCGCGFAPMDASFMWKLQSIRTAHTKPMYISSGYRCPSHNKTASSTGLTGPHTTGCAADILCSGSNATSILRFAVGEGMTGFGLKQKGPHSLRFIHLDNLQPSETTPPGLRPWVWTY